MTQAVESTRRFRVYARHVDGHHARVLVETSFEAAAVAYLEDFDLEAPINDDPDISVIVHDMETGREHCFKVDLDSGLASPCG